MAASGHFLAALAVCLVSVIVSGAASTTTHGVVPRQMAQPESSGAWCFHEASSTTGRCVPLPQCAIAVRERNQGLHPQLCGWDSNTWVPDACCPTAKNEQRPQDLQQRPQNSQRPQGLQDSQGTAALPLSVTCQAFNASLASGNSRGPGSAAEKVCMSYQEQICSGKIILNRSGGGGGFGFVPADPLEYPHMALLGAGPRDDIQYFCGGSLISPNFVLTAAHCVTLEGKALRWVLLGAVNRTAAGKGDASTRQLLEAAEVIAHPEYTPSTRYHDIALVRLAQDARLATGDVRPACLHTDVDDEPVGKTAVVSGWGAEAFGDDGSESLLKGAVKVRPLRDCDPLGSGSDPRLPRGLDASMHMCAGGNGDTATDACHGDSGGPLQFPAAENEPECIFRVAAVVSFGPPCGIGLPGVYTRVAPYVPWIEATVWPRTAGSCAPADTGPGTVARRACRGFLSGFCSGFRVYMPGLTTASRCHFQAAGQRFQATQPDEFPHQAFLMYGPLYAVEIGCAGTLISTNFVLTAAHCVTLDCIPVSAVQLGLQNRQFGAVAYPNVTQIFVHPEYDSVRRLNDIALLRLSRDVDLRIEVRPACLHTDVRDEPKHVIGTGLTANGRWENVKSSLVKVDLSTQSASVCADVLRKNGSSFNIDSQLCTGGPPDRAIYPGESGGPLQRVHRRFVGLNWTRDNFMTVDDVSVYKVAGVLSSPSVCGSDLPDIYTNVAAFLPWIENIVWPDSRG